MDMVEAAWQARLALEYTRQGGRTALSGREHSGPLLVQKALYPEGDAVCHSIIVHPPGGIAGGDALKLEVRLREDTAALLTTPGAGKWYKSMGPKASLAQQLRHRTRRRARMAAATGDRVRCGAGRNADRSPAA